MQHTAIEHELTEQRNLKEQDYEWRIDTEREIRIFRERRKN